jgi:hypothetical protein
VGLDLVTVAVAVFLPDGVAGRGQVANDAVGAALGDAHRGRDVAQPHARVMGDARQEARPCLVEKLQPSRLQMLPQILEMNC